MMNYIEWNNLLGDQLFKQKRKEQEVFLFLTKEQVIEAGWQAAEAPGAFDPDEEAGECLDDAYIWRNFLGCVKAGPAGAGGNSTPLLDRTYKCFTRWLALRPAGKSLGERILRQNGEEILVRHPLHLAYLLLFTMPFGSGGAAMTSRGYYDSLNNWLHDNNLLPSGGRVDKIALREIGGEGGWQRMWQSVGEWSTVTCGGALGAVRNRANAWPAWPYVGWPLAQCLLPPRALQQLKQFFVKNNLVPGIPCPPARMRQLLLHTSGEELSLPQLTRTSLAHAESELGNSIVEMVLGMLRTWNGSTNYSRRTSYPGEDGHPRSGKEQEMGETMARLMPFVQLDPANERVIWYHRVRIQIPLPDDFTLHGSGYEPTPCPTATPEWSAPVRNLGIGFSPKVLYDPVNRWRAVYRPTDTQLFVAASRYGLPHWAPVEELEQGVEMLLLCREGEIGGHVRAWGQAFGARGSFLELKDYDGIPEGHCLFRLKNPVNACPGVGELVLATGARLVAEGGMRWAARTYLQALPPGFRLINAAGEHSVCMRLAEGQVLTLERDSSEPNKWYLPREAAGAGSFTVFVAGLELATDGYRYELAQPVTSPAVNGIKKGPYNDDLTGQAPDMAGTGMVVFYNGYQLEEACLPVKNPAALWSPPHNWHNSAASSPLEKIRNHMMVYSPIFNPVVGNHWHGTGESGKGHDELLHLLTTKGKLTLAEFSAAYDSLWSTRHRSDQDHGLPTTVQKRGVMRLYSHMGFGDYGYRKDSEQITALAPTLLALPTRTASVRRMLLTGGRTPALLGLVREYIRCSAPEIELLITGPDASNRTLILPDTIVLQTAAHNEEAAKNKFGALAQACGIRYIGYEAHVPVELVLFAGSLRQYAEKLSPNPHVARDGWRKKVFVPSALKWQDVADDESFKQGKHLMEYTLSDFERRYVWWDDGCPHQVDKNWGRYLALYEAQERVIIQDHEMIAVPAAAPLPELLARALVLLSGHAPTTDQLPCKNGLRRFNVYRQPGAGLLIHLLTQNLGQA
ncbi:hypothetical protein LGH70_22375 [Hymenobacter sp. BT635]|uniref:Uncharacterized protein n=1 Tax=Hymenobacter nitidus TaxID=2880929 RepID=A0ABS8AIU9_9BACT|nr:hypothetical protein [Hymenobacter nitidus]MCB2380355.1 hypothetical protein [Hymenobacter nitidus]